MIGGDAVQSEDEEARMDEDIEEGNIENEQHFENEQEDYEMEAQEGEDHGGHDEDDDDEEEEGDEDVHDVVDEGEDPEGEIAQTDAWSVISAYFNEKGLVLQQLESFNEFISNKIQEIVEENGEINVTPESQKNPGEEDLHEKMEIRVKFKQIYISKPSIHEVDGEQIALFPKEARLRNLTYSAQLCVDSETPNNIKIGRAHV
eukprot:TRINITY_DN17094_c0_g2_i1.p1 TRINITY_DN17094_c0_g2~~TRINITY_DN17094_c0_g2_i1.p1  ORF type:complete len:203 (+),score=66.17 TRINITY_DN17094_c0_g2_i1:98-706(+)